MKPAVLLSTLWSLTGCATMISGTTQEMSFQRGLISLTPYLMWHSPCMIKPNETA